MQAIYKRYSNITLTLENSTITQHQNCGIAIDSPLSHDILMMYELASSELLHCRYTAVALLLHYRCTIFPLYFLCCHTFVALLFHSCCTVAPLLLHCWSTVVTLVLHCCSTVVPLLLHCWSTLVPLLFHCRSRSGGACLENSHRLKAEIRQESRRALYCK
jgi:hypothetical protein